jgi:hypothetical protein
MYHPAAALHQASLRETLFDDMRGLPAALLSARRELEAERLATAQSDEAARQATRAAPPTDGSAAATQQMTLFQER